MPSFNWAPSRRHGFRIFGGGVFAFARDLRARCFHFPAPRKLTERYRQLFPDFLDLLMVCVDAGLSLQMAMDRVTDHIIKHNREFGMNLMMMGEELARGAV